MTTVGEVDHPRNGFDPHAILTDWATGSVSHLPDGRRLCEFEIVAEDKEIEIAPGVMFPAWTLTVRVPWPTQRGTNGARVRVRFGNPGSHHPPNPFPGLPPATTTG